MHLAQDAPECSQSIKTAGKRRVSNNDVLRQKIDDAKRRLAMPSLMRRLGYDEKHIGKSALCPFHSDERPSFSVFERKDNTWWHKCFVGCSEGDEIAFLAKARNISTQEAITLYLDMAGFPPSRPLGSHEWPEPHECPASHEYPQSRQSHEYPEYPVYPVSNGQRPVEALNAFAARNACTEYNTARKRRWQLVRDLRALEKGIGRQLNIGELMVAFDEWHRLSQPFLDRAKTREDYLAAFLAERGKVWVPTGEGDTFNKALEAVAKLSDSELPVILGMPDAPDSWRRLAALHRELSRLSGGKTHFLSCRDAAKASPGLIHQTAHNINLVLAQRGVIKIVRVGDARPNGKASEFQYLLSQSENGAEENDEGIEI